MSFSIYDIKKQVYKAWIDKRKIKKLDNNKSKKAERNNWE